GRDEKGTPRQVCRIIRGGKREAAKELAKMSAGAHAERRVGPTATLGKLCSEWLKNVERQRKARSTIDTYSIHLEKHIKPALGDVRLDKLTAHAVDRYLCQLADKGLAVRTIRTDHAILSAALAQGVSWGWLPSNPATRAKLPTDHREAPSITVEQLGRMYAAALEDDPDVVVVIALGALTSCRRGELAGLRWSDFDREKGTLRVERAWVPERGGQYLNEFTKTKQRRTVFIGALGVTLLDRYRVFSPSGSGRTWQSPLASSGTPRRSWRPRTCTPTIGGALRPAN
ncbi:MAG: tyrosine-type recombinase/integrase, partial [Acidimicrobiales bacterium]